MNTETYCERQQKMKKIVDLIECLPDDVKRSIYDNYFEGKKLYDTFIKVLHSDECVRLDISELIPLWGKIRRHPCALEYMKKTANQKNNILNETNFSYHYNEHYTENKKSFKRLCLDDSFLLCLLMTMYH